MDRRQLGRRDPAGRPPGRRLAHHRRHEEGLRERVEALGRALAAAGRDRDGFTLSVRVRADVARVARIAPRIRELGVDHLLVDLPVFAPARFRDDVGRLRELVGPARDATVGVPASRSPNWHVRVPIGPKPLHRSGPGGRHPPSAPSMKWFRRERAGAAPSASAQG